MNDDVATVATMDIMDEVVPYMYPVVRLAAALAVVWFAGSVPQ